jgi:hypothetical protein
VGCVDRSPPVLGGFDEFERHREAGGPAAGILVTRGRCRTVATVDSNGFEVRRCLGAVQVGEPFRRDLGVSLVFGAAALSMSLNSWRFADRVWPSTG